jgi:hypothetical protein
MGARPRRWSLRRVVLGGAALLLSAVSLTYTALWVYSSRPGLTTLREDLGLPRGDLLEPGVQLGFELRYLPRLVGARVGPIKEGSPAERAGLRRDDVIVAIDERSLAQSAAPFLAVYRAARPGDPVELTVRRPGSPEPIVLKGRVAPRTLVLAVALPVLFLRVEDPRAWRLAALFVCLAAAPGTPAGIGGEGATLRAFAMAYKGASGAVLAFSEGEQADDQTMVIARVR